MSATTLRRGILRRYWIVVVVLLVGLAASLGSFAMQRRANLEHRAAELDWQVDQRLETLQETFIHGVVLVADLQAYMGASSANRGRQHFGTLADHLVKMHGGLQALSWIPRVSGAERESFEASVRNEGLRDFHIIERGADGRPVTAGARGEYFPITIAAPAAGNAAVLGYDLGSDPARREVLERARDTGSPAASAPVRLLSVTDNRLAVLVVGPVYWHALSDATVDERRADLAGFVASVFRVADAVDSSLLDIANSHGETHGFDDYIFDGDQLRSDRLIYVHASQLRAIGDEPPPFDRVSEAYRWIHKIDIAGRQWTVLTVALSRSFAYPLETNEWASLFGGFLLAALAAQYVVLTTRRSYRLRTLTNSLLTKTQELEQEVDKRKRIAERLETASAIVEQSPVMLARWRIEGEPQVDLRAFVPEYLSSNISQLGYTSEEFMSGKADFFQHILPEDRAAMISAFQAAAGQNRSDLTNVFRFQKPNGDLHWLEGHLVLEHDAGGRPVRGLGTLRDVTERREIEQKLEFANSVLRTEMDSSPDGILVVDNNGMVISWNRRLAEIHHVSETAMPTFSAMEASAVTKDPERFRAKVRYFLEHPEASGRDEVEFADGRVFDRYTRSMYDSTGKYLGRVFFMRDVTDYRKAEADLIFANTVFKTEMDNSPDGTIVVGKDGRIISYNKRLVEMRQVPEEVLQTRDDARIVAAVAKGVKDEEQFLSRIKYYQEHPDASGEEELSFKDGVVIDWRTRPLRSAAGKYLGRVHFMRDVTERRKAEERIGHMARHDALTGLANRAVFVEAAQMEVSRMSRDGKGFAVLYLDLDHFKDVNDTLGHPVGDLLLISVAKRLRACVRGIDTVARLGGDEFAVLETDVEGPGDAAVLATKLIGVLGEPYEIDGNEIRIGTSIGIDVFGPESPDAVALLSHADVALYRAKSEGRHTYRFFTEAMNEEVKLRVQLGNEMRKAVASNQIFLVYQPQVNLETGRIIGVEALVRWRHPERGVLLPGEFIAAAEENGLILPLGSWVLEEACRQAKKWLDAGLAVPSIAINVSGVQFKSGLGVGGGQSIGDGGFEKQVAAVLSTTALPPGVLELELTESSFMATSQEHNDVLSRIRESGVKIAIDDFGTGYSSLDYLRTFPVDRVKIAQNFVIDLKRESGEALIVKAAIGLARALGLRVIAEGVETAEQVALLKEWGCVEAQGFYFAEPLTAEAIEPVLRAGRIVPRKAVLAKQAM